MLCLAPYWRGAAAKPFCLANALFKPFGCDYFREVSRTFTKQEVMSLRFLSTLENSIATVFVSSN